MSSQTKQRIVFFSLTMVLAVSASVANGQVIDPGIPPVDQPPVQVPDTDTGNQGGEETGNISDSGDSNLDLSESLDIGFLDDTRNQGFVGATAPGIQGFGFVGAASDNSGPPLAEGATFGGGVNETGGGGGGGGARGNAGQGQGFGPAQDQNGFTVIRRNLRAQLRPRYEVTRVSPAEISSRFNNRFYRLPESDAFAGKFSISIENRTATINGAVQSQEESDRIVRQLRLEPGVYRINNQLQILN
jgi:hypothetical protein